MEEEVREPYLEIIEPGAGNRLITAIEILSPSNKTPGDEGRGSYRKKQDEVLNSDIHLLEIDLLRGGAHTVAPAYEDILLKCSNWDYLISLHRHQKRWKYELWHCSLRSPLPKIMVPLTAGDTDITIDLQSIFDTVYDEGYFPRRIDYRSVPAKPLNPGDEAWADNLLKAKGLR